MKRLLVCIAALAAAGASVPAQAQLATGYSGYSSAPTEASEEEYWRMMGRLGDCLADRKQDEARTFLGTVIDSAEEDAAFEALFHRSRNGCMGNFVNAGMLRAHVRGLVAEGLFEQLPDETIASFMTSPPSAPETVETLHEFARCYAVAHPSQARGLLSETRIATEGELEYVREIAGGFGPCLPQGRDVRLNPVSVRLAIAEALYHAATGGAAPTIQGQ